MQQRRLSRTGAALLALALTLLGAACGDDDTATAGADATDPPQDTGTATSGAEAPQDTDTTSVPSDTTTTDPAPVDTTTTVEPAEMEFPEGLYRADGYTADELVELGMDPAVAPLLALDYAEEEFRDGVLTARLFGSALGDRTCHDTYTVDGDIVSIISGGECGTPAGPWIDLRWSLDGDVLVLEVVAEHQPLAAAVLVDSYSQRIRISE